jgi:hypothetical protein
MTEEFPPRTTHEREVAILLEGFASVVERGTGTYVSSPLTTGQRAFEWHRLNGPSTTHDTDAHERFRTNVIEPNRSEAARFARRLRAEVGGAVIDPTAMADISGWTQADYRVFWGRVIEEYCDVVVFRDGWQYSSGCTYEFLVAQMKGTRILGEDMSPLSLAEGKRLVDVAIEETEARGTSARFLRAVRDALQNPQALVHR